MQSTPLTCVRTRCRTSLVPTAVQRSYTLHVCRHYRWLHSYALLVCHQHRRPEFIRVAKPLATHCCPTLVGAARLPTTSSTCVRTPCRTSSVRTAVLHSYMLRICHHYRWLHSYMLLISRQHRRPALVSVAEPRWYRPLSYIRTRCTSVAITAGYIRTCCLSAINIVDLCSYTLQNLVATPCCPTFVRAACLPSTSSSCVRTRCRSSLEPTALLHSYALLVCNQHR